MGGRNCPKPTPSLQFFHRAGEVIWRFRITKAINEFLQVIKFLSSRTKLIKISQAPCALAIKALVPLKIVVNPNKDITFY